MGSRISLLVGLAGLMVGCGVPHSLLPLAARAVTPEEQQIAVPTEDGSHYILVEAKPNRTDSGLARMWRRTAEDACKGEYILLSAAKATRRAQGVNSMRIQEGWVRCINPEALEEPTIKRAKEPKTSAPRQTPRRRAPQAFAL